MMTPVSSSSSGGNPGAVVLLNDLNVVAPHEALLRANHLDSLEALFTIARGESLGKPGLDRWRERIKLVLSHDGVKSTCFLKRFTSPPRRARREVGRSGSAARSVAGMEWAWMGRMVRDHIACVQPMAFGQELVGGRERRSAILTKAVPGKSLEAWMSEWSEADQPVIRGLIDPVAGLVARLHNAGYIHRDLYLSHVFYDPTAGLERSLHLIDLQRVRRPRLRLRRWIVKDLAALNYSTPARLVSRADRLRWLKRYLGVPRLDTSARRLAYRVMGKTLSITRHDRRRAVRLSAPAGRDGAKMR